MFARRSPTSASAIRSRSTISYVVWNALKNNYWPAHYFFDAQGRQRYHHFGEGEYEQSEMRHPPAARGGRSTRRRCA